MAARDIILYIDDEHLNLKLFESKLGVEYHVLTAESGPAGLELLSRVPAIKAVICDMKMPEMTGLEFAGIACVKYPSIKYFLITGFEVNEPVLNAIRSGLVRKCFTKPFNFRDILQSLNDEICNN